MKALPKILLALTAVAALSVAYPAKANLITNPGFETGNFAGWTPSATGTFVVGTATGVAPHSGSFQAVGTSGALSQTLMTMAGQSYTIDFFVAHQGGQPGNSFTATWGGSTILSLTNPGTFGYTHYTFTVTAPTASTALGFTFFDFHGIYFLDDVSVNPTGVGVPDGGTTVMLLGAALGALGMARRFLKI